MACFTIRFTRTCPQVLMTADALLVKCIYLFSRGMTSGAIVFTRGDSHILMTADALFMQGFHPI